MYLIKHNDWPAFRWDVEGLSTLTAEVRHRQGRLFGRMEARGFRTREEAVLDALTQDVLKSGEDRPLDRDQARSERSPQRFYSMFSQIRLEREGVPSFRRGPRKGNSTSSQPIRPRDLGAGPPAC